MPELHQQEKVTRLQGLFSIFFVLVCLFMVLCAAGFTSLIIFARARLITKVTAVAAALTFIIGAIMQIVDVVAAAVRGDKSIIEVAFGRETRIRLWWAIAVAGIFMIVFVVGEFVLK